jgi:hypothetical protein
LQEYVQNLAGLTPELVDLSGFHHNKIEQTKGATPGQTSVEKSEAVGNGAMKLTLSVDLSAFGYVAVGYELTEKEPSLLQINQSVSFSGEGSPFVIFGISSTHNVVLNNLSIGKSYRIFVYTFNAKGSGTLSQPYLLVSHS